MKTPTNLEATAAVLAFLVLHGAASEERMLSEARLARHLQ